MTKENKEKLIQFLKGYNCGTMVLFYDQINDRRIDLDVWYEKSEDDIYISGDEGEKYELSELELIDDRIIKLQNPITDKEKDIFKRVDDMRIAIQKLSTNRRDTKDDGAALDFLGREFGKIIRDWRELINPEIELEVYGCLKTFSCEIENCYISTCKYYEPDKV